MALITSGAYVLYHYKSEGVKTTQVSSPLAQVPVQQVAEAQEKDRVVTSSDGIKSLTMKITHGENNSTTYTFHLQDGTSIFTKTVGAGESMDIPDNAWAPGENYIFLEQTASNGAKDYLALKATGEAFPDGQQALDVGVGFAAKYAGYKFNGATGWADPGLLIVESTNPDGSTGPSFWYELPGGSFIQLSGHQ